MSSGIVIVWQTEEPTHYRPQEANLMSIRTKSSELSLFNPPRTIYEIISLTLQPSNSSTCKCTQDDDSQTTKTIA